jgi:septal ring factor EnvC (AmiA/AmiB activator)
MARDSIIASLKDLQASMADVKGDIAAMKTDMTDMKADIGGIKADLSDVKADIGDMKSDIGGLKYEVIAGFKRVDNQLDAARLRDEHMVRTIKFSFEAVQAHREVSDAKFDTVIKEMRGNTDLLKSALVHVRRRVERVETRKPRRRS